MKTRLRLLGASLAIVAISLGGAVVAAAPAQAALPEPTCTAGASPFGTGTAELVKNPWSSDVHYQVALGCFWNAYSLDIDATLTQWSTAHVTFNTWVTRFNAQAPRMTYELIGRDLVGYGYCLKAGKRLTAGLQHVCVSYYQKAINNFNRMIGKPTIAVTGVFDAATVAGTKTIETKVGLAADGVVDWANWTRTDLLLARYSDFTARYTACFDYHYLGSM